MGRRQVAGQWPTRLLALALTALVLTTAASADEPARLPAAGSQSTAEYLNSAVIEKPRVVLLKNDRCLTGIVRQLGDQVIIEIDNDLRVSKPSIEVLCVADDLEGIYRYKRGRYTQLGPGEHIRLARWSLAMGLHAHASEHFLAVNRESSSHPIVKQLGVELREQLLKDEAFRDYLGLPPVAKAPSESIAQSTTAESSVQSVSAGSDSTAAPIVPAVLTTFADHVQPILLKRCSQSGCHGLSSSNGLKFVQPIGNARARISEQNCRSALQFVQVDDSNMSTLLRYAVVAHGLQKTAAITAQEPKLVETLQSWTTFARNPVMAAVDQQPVGTNATGATPAVFTESSPGGAVHPLAPASASATGSVPAVLKPLAPGASQLRTVPSNPSLPAAGTGTPTQREIDELDDLVRRALGEPPRQSDPFDPAEFNRRAAAQAAANQAVAPATRR